MYPEDRIAECERCFKSAPEGLIVTGIPAWMVWGEELLAQGIDPDYKTDVWLCNTCIESLKVIYRGEHRKEGNAV